MVSKNFVMNAQSKQEVQSLIERSEEKPVVTKNVPCSWLRN
jgi:hypothetical protein